MTTPINPFATASTSGATTTSTTATKSNSSLNKDDFLKLLMTQMQNQDPTAPMDDAQTMAQMAQFSSLEQMQNMNTSTLATQANSMIGKNVTWTDTSNVVQTGKVTAVSYTTGNPPALIVGTGSGTTASTVNVPVANVTLVSA